ncbi:hypothetical protein [Cloacibacterium sp.]|uniref:hypothetical protein n=1 Tax=Cloacibacterium sp. TaxID=1913682 RepID=UPI0039E3B096
MEEVSQFEEFDYVNTKNQRRKLLPIWIKVFIWIFFIFGGIGILLLLFAPFSDNIDLSIYGISTTNPKSIAGISIILLFILKGMVSYGLWFEKKWGINIAQIDAVLGIIICTATMFYGSYSKVGEKL